eukprot:TRINITY_DN6307_c0_g1_i1.p1 TRINITY_DN6307_c0_g1~~TRINITY_DN6307_c0_g1_i1.p1  ORF type:complete len:408 (+),score=55.81 TRINITY_DN6307_c0_g1_i1:48-1226(+)
MIGRVFRTLLHVGRMARMPRSSFRPFMMMKMMARPAGRRRVALIGTTTAVGTLSSFTLFSSSAKNNKNNNVGDNNNITTKHQSSSSSSSSYSDINARYGPSTILHHVKDPEALNRTAIKLLESNQYEIVKVLLDAFADALDVSADIENIKQAWVFIRDLEVSFDMCVLSGMGINSFEDLYVRVSSCKSFVRDHRARVEELGLRIHEMSEKLTRVTVNDENISDLFDLSVISITNCVKESYPHMDANTSQFLRNHLQLLLCNSIWYYDDIELKMYPSTSPARGPPRLLRHVLVRYKIGGPDGPLDYNRLFKLHILAQLVSESFYFQQPAMYSRFATVLQTQHYNERTEKTLKDIIDVFADAMELKLSNDDKFLMMYWFKHALQQKSLELEKKE